MPVLLDKIRVCEEPTFASGAGIACLHSDMVSALAKLEQARELRWAERQPDAITLKLRWRASVIQHVLGVVPEDTILEFGAGSGLLTAELGRVLHGENRITAVSFSRQLAGVPMLPPNQFDFAVGSGMLLHSRFADCLSLIFECLKPGGEMLFFEPNFAFPARLFNEMRLRDTPFTVARVVESCREAGFADVDVAPHDIVSTNLSRRWMTSLQGKAILLEHLPVVRSACATVRVMARKPGARVKRTLDLTSPSSLSGAVSVVIPARNEAENIPRLVGHLLTMYGRYIHEIVVVNDGSTDGTEAVLHELAAQDSRVRAVNRSKPNGVGLALRDGYRAATGRYILSMDCDFVGILPQFRNLFKAVEEGHDGAIGSRFSHDSILAGYPFPKLLFNRLCHAAIKLFLISTVRDITNNLKLYRAEIFKEMNIQSRHFSANLETGLAPLLAGYDIVEVPISWVNRTDGMGASSFSVRRVGMDYAKTLLRFMRQTDLLRGRGILQKAALRVWRAI